jgi:quinol monooxygenase YgiN
MIFIVVKFTVRPEYSDQWLDLVSEFTRDVRAEEGCLFFEWSTSVETPHQFVVVEAYKDAAAGEAHVKSAHFEKAMAWMPDYISKKPDIVNTEVPQQGWGEMGELTPR